MLAASNRIVATLLFSLLITSCRSLDPVPLPPEFTSTAPDSVLWQELRTLRPGDWQVPLNTGAEALDWRLRAIDTAADSIDLQTFLWTFDTVGALVLDHLLDAAERGVTVKLLIDDSFLAGEEGMLLALARHPNIEYRVYNPFTRRSSNVVTRQILNLAEFHRLDHRMHNKSMIIDNRIAIVGGRNLADEYFGLNDTANFRDMELIVGGPIVDQVSTAFDTYWNDQWSVPIESMTHIEPAEADMELARQVRNSTLHLHTEESEAERHTHWRRLVSSAYTGLVELDVDEPPTVNPADPGSAPVQVRNGLVSLMDAATDDILIISAYLIPTPILEGAIERAAARGVTVRILTNSIGSNNHLTAHSAYRNHISTLMSHGAQLHEVRVDAEQRDLYIIPPVETKSLALHAKVLIIDSDRVFIGSANLDPRSLRLNTEMGLLVTSQPLNQALRRQVEPDFSTANAWRLEFAEDGDVIWISDDLVLEAQPALSPLQRIEDWLFAHLPLENEM
ncbi:MAG: phospholipase D family protein [Gammaproteobacteria bacterium]